MAANVPPAETPTAETHTAETRREAAEPRGASRRRGGRGECHYPDRAGRGPAARPPHGRSGPAQPVESAPPEDVAAPYPYDQGEYATEGGHGDSADDAANAEDPDSNSDVDLDTYERDLDLVDDRDPVR